MVEIAPEDVRGSHDEGAVCECVADHNPNPMELNRHHIHPLGFNPPGERTPDNEVWLCPTSHANVHELLRAWVKYEGEPPWEVQRRFSRYIRWLAEDGYRRWIASQEFGQ